LRSPAELLEVFWGRSGGVLKKKKDFKPNFKGLNRRNEEIMSGQTTMAKEPGRSVCNLSKAN
jgi:hypothetical protein